MSLLSLLAPHVPFVRRYARALTGDQSTGDRYVRLALEAIAAGEGSPRIDEAPRVALYHVFQSVWAAGGGQVGARADGAEARLMAITPRSRQAFLLTAVEGFSHADTATILALDPVQVADLIAQAQVQIDAQLATDVLIIEDEAIIAADLEALVQELGHRVTGVAATRDQARRLAAARPPGLVLADIQLADGSSGVDAVHDILTDANPPVIFITAFPERLLTGERPEPTFLITKPFLSATVRATIGQALFFHPQGSKALA